MSNTKSAEDCTEQGGGGKDNKEQAAGKDETNDERKRQDEMLPFEPLTVDRLHCLWSIRCLGREENPTDWVHGPQKHGDHAHRIHPD